MVQSARDAAQIGLGGSGVLACLAVAWRTRLVAVRPEHAESGRRPSAARPRSPASTGPARQAARTVGPAAAALRVAQGRESQCAARALQRSPGRLGVPAQGPAGRDRRRIRELAAHPRQRRRRRLGLSEHAVRQAHRAGGALAQGRAPCRSMRMPRAAAAGLSPGSRRAWSATSKTCTGEWCDIDVPAAIEGWIEQPMLWGVYPGERSTIDFSVAALAA